MDETIPGVGPTGLSLGFDEETEVGRFKAF
jgi:hypothetical protein